MCKQCTPLTVKNFSSSEEFRDFDTILQAKCVDGTFVRVVNVNETNNAMDDDSDYYQCTFCETDWVLFFDSRSESGYFLPTDAIMIREDHQTHEANGNFRTFQVKRSKGCGCCLGMILLFLGLIIYGLYSLISFLFDLLF